MLAKLYEGGRRTGFIVLLVGLAVIGLGVWSVQSGSQGGLCGVLALPFGLVIAVVGLAGVVFG